MERLPGTATADGHQYPETLYTAGAGLLQPLFTFVSKEQILSKTGGSNDASHGFAGNWHIPLHEKLEAGNILTGLTIQEKQSSGPGKGYDLIELHIPTHDEDFLPNFRTGDMVILYAYKENRT